MHNLRLYRLTASFHKRLFRYCVCPLSANFSSYPILFAQRVDKMEGKRGSLVGKKKSMENKNGKNVKTDITAKRLVMKKYEISGWLINVQVVRDKKELNEEIRLKSGKINAETKETTKQRISPYVSPLDDQMKIRDEAKNEPFENDSESPKAYLSYIFVVLILALIMIISRIVHYAFIGVKLSWMDFKEKVLPKEEIEKIVVLKMFKNSRNEGNLLVFMKMPEEVKYPMKIKFAYEPYKLYKVEVSKMQILEDVIEELYKSKPENWVSIENKSMENEFMALFLLIASLICLFFASIPYLLKIEHAKLAYKNFKISVLEPGHKKLNIKFKDVAGLHEAKTEIREFVDYVKNPQKYTKLGAKLPKGAILTGPPGCGKTLLARALAAESRVPFISINGMEFVEVYGGLGASRVRKLFSLAKSKSPCIVYIDEIDSIGRKRGNDISLGGGPSEEEQTLNQLLVEMDGVDSAKGIIMLASTNRPDVLDKALLRPGRFDRHISVDLPTILEREGLFKLYLKKIKFSRCNRMSTELPKLLGQLTSGFSGADIANVVNEGAMIAANHKKKFVYREDLHAALEKVLAGPEKRSRVLQDDERHIVAYHEAGHCLVGWYLKHTDALLKVTIVPRTNAALGFAQYKPRDRKLYRKEELFDRMCVILGGRAAEDVKFNQITSSAQSDLEKATKLAYRIVKRYGMSDVIGPMSFVYPGRDEREDIFQTKPYSKKLHSLMDQEIQRIVTEAYTSARELVIENLDKLDLLAQELYKQEVLDYERIRELIGSPNYDENDEIEN